ncbi:MAG: hypothetical protein FJY10_00605 [Bacteroidetes bacterium]|nr:hypothetical protein [Bacteroidota bacterium]
MTYHLIQQNGLIFGLGHFGKVRKFSGDSGQGIDLFNDGTSEFFQLFRIARIVFLPSFSQELDTEFHRCQRVLDLMGHLHGHLPPGTFPFRCR